MGTPKTKAQNKYIAKTYDRINLVVPKGRKDVIEECAKRHNETLTAFLNRIINEAIEKESQD